MKRIFYAIVLFIVGGLLLTGCTKNYTSITYTKFVESFNNREGYILKDMTLQNQGVFERTYVAGIDNIQMIYYEFKTTEEAKNYVKQNFENRDGYSYSDKETYITVKSTSSGYFYLVQVDKMVLIGTSDDKGDKGTINSLFKELGY